MNKHDSLLSSDRISGLLRQARLSAGLSLRELAKRAGTSHSAIAAYEAQRKMPSIPVIERLLSACNVDAIQIILTRRIREKDGLPRGVELEQVLALAEQFPARPEATLNFPGFRHHE